MKRALVPRMHETVIKLLLAFVVLLLPAGCATRPPPSQPLSPTQVTDLVTARTLHISAACSTPPAPYSTWCYVSRCGCIAPGETLLYLAPGGSGWLNHLVIPGDVPRPGNMSLVLDWRVVGPSQVCFWASPLIGEMPAFVPPHLECILVFRTTSPHERLWAAVTQSGVPESVPLTLDPFNAFPSSVTDQYLEQVRVLYGGNIPDRNIPPK